MTSPFSLLWELFSEATKNVKKAPGWVPLAATCFVLAQLIPDDFVVLRFRLYEHTEVIAVLATAVLYIVGDALDHVLFAKLTRQIPARLGRSREAVKTKLHLTEQLYDVSLKLAVAAEKYEGTRIQLQNETAKFTRSLAVLTFAFFVAVPLWHCWLPDVAPLVALALSLTPVLFGVSVCLKIDHMCNLYDTVATELADSPLYSFHDLPNHARMFFWNETLVSSGPRGTLSEHGGFLHSQGHEP